MESQHDDHENDGTSLNERLNMIPVYAMTLSSLQNAYSSMKERHDVLKSAFNKGEQYMQAITNVAKPVVLAATNTALTVVKPVVGDIADPVGTMDCVASEAVAKVQEKFPIINQTPSMIVSTAKTAVQDTASSCVHSVQDKATSCVQSLQRTSTAQIVTNKLDDAVSASELMVEMCFPTDGSDPVDMMELEQAEQDEDKGVLTRASNLKARTERRGKKKLQTYRAVQVTMDVVQYAQDKVSQISQVVQHGTSYITSIPISQAVQQGTDYITSKVHGTSIAPKDEQIETEASVETPTEKVAIARPIGVFDHAYATTMFIPKMAMQVSGEVFVSTKEMIFSYSKAHSVKEMPHAIVEMSDKYYKQLKASQPMVASMEEKAVAFVLVPAQVVSHYIASNLPIQWILPKGLQTNQISFVEGEEIEEADESGATALLNGATTPPPHA